ncbi:MAG: Ig-like domain repeat protein [Terracidiphilus sp.]
MPVLFRAGIPLTFARAAFLSLLWLFCVAGSLCAQTPTTTTLAVTNTGGSSVTSVSSGTVVVLTASVAKTAGGEVTLGTVNFCDATATYCEDAHLIGSAQVTSRGTAVYKFVPAAGSHSYNAVFHAITHGTNLYAASTSSAESLTVTGGPFPTTTSIVPSGSVGNYTLTATVSSSNGAALSPSGTVDFLDTSNNNYVLGSGTLTSGPSVLSYSAPAGAGTGGGTQPMWSVMADFNQDGIPDIAVLDFNNPNNGLLNQAVEIFFGNADGTFTKQTTLEDSTSGGAAIVTGDLNGDGYPDLVVALDGELDVFLNNGRGGFNAPINYNFTYTDFASNFANNLPSALAIGDVNNDGHLDVVITFASFDASGTSPYTMPPAANMPGQVGVALGNGDGTLQIGGNAPYIPFYGSETYQPNAVALADLTGNGNLDIITGGGGSGVSVLAGNGDGTFQNALNTSSYTTQPNGSSVLVVGDFNGDGKPDVAFTGEGNAFVGLLLGNGDLTFQPGLGGAGNLIATYQAGGTNDAIVDGLAVADINGDGILDLVAPDKVDNTVTVMLGNGDGTFQAPLVNADLTVNSQVGLIFPAGNGPYSIQAGSFNGSGTPSLAVVDENGNSVGLLTGSMLTTATATATGLSPVGSASGLDEVEASYLGDSYYSTSISTLASLVPQPVPTTLALASNLSTVTVGGQVTLTATLTPAFVQNYTPSGAVTFYVNGASIGSATPSNGVATLTPNLATAQTDSITATYAGDNNFIGSTSSAVSVTVQKAATSLTLQVCNYVGTAWVCPATTSTYGGEIELTATLSPYNVTGGSSSDHETVTFYNGAAVAGTATLSDGVATLVLSQPAAGSYSFTASYGGDASFLASSTSPAASMTVAQVTPSVTLGVSPSGTTSYGQTVFLTATFQTYPGTVTGETVTFYNGTSIVGTAMFGSNSSPAMLTLTNIPAGSYNFKASYPGDSNYFSTTTTVSSLTVQPLATNLSIVSSPSGAVLYGNPVTLQAFLVPYNEADVGGATTNNETVTFKNGANIVGYGTLTNGTATLTITLPPVGSYAFTASYTGDTDFATSTTAQPANFMVEKASTTMGITTSASNGIIGSGQPVTLTATVAPSLATGTVTFFNGSTNIGTGTLSNGSATLTLSNGLAEGSYTFSASYGGDANFNGSSTSPDAGLVVLQATTVTLTANPSHYASVNQPITLTATLSPYSVGSNSTNGEGIIFYMGSTNLGNTSLSNGVATFIINAGLSEGEYSFTAAYQGDTYLAGSSTASPLAFSVATIENFVVNTALDDSGAASNCTPQSSTTHNATDSACSLRDAVLAAGIVPEGANITFDTTAFPGPTTITLTNGTISVPSNTTLTGPTLYSGANLTNLVTVNGNGTSINQPSSTVFSVSGTGTAISNLIITGGWPQSFNNAPGNGGGISNSGQLTLTNSTITNNGTQSSGAGIYNTGNLKVIGSTIAGNTASVNSPGQGGGIDNENNGQLSLINSTVANNQAQDGYGGGIAVGSGMASITNSTISGNTPAYGGGGIDNISGGSGGTVSLSNSIVSGNNDALTDISGSYNNIGGNIVGYFNGSAVSNPNTFNSGPLNLGPLDNYGGPTQTMLPLPGSPAICAGNILYSPSFFQPPPTQISIDQRGYPNTNSSYLSIPFTPLTEVCVDAGAVQTNYTSIQFQQTSYEAVAGGAVAPTVLVAVAENGANRGAVPVTLSYSGPGNLSGNTSTTVEGFGGTFPGLSVDTVGNGTLSTTMYIVGTGRLTASTSLSILPPLVISPGGTVFSIAMGVPFYQCFVVSNGSGSYQLSNTGTLPPGLTLTPSSTATGTTWTLSGTPTQNGSFTFTLTATDVTNSVVTLSQNYTVSVEPATTTTLTASPATSAPLGQTVTLTATVSSPTANGTVIFVDSGFELGSVNLSGGAPNVVTLALNAATLGTPLPFGTHNFTAYFLGDATDAPSISNSVPYSVTSPNFVVNTTSDDAGSFTCTTLASTTSNTTDGNNGGNPGLCTLRDAIDTAYALGAGSIYFDSTVFAASNLVGNPAANTISPSIALNGSLIIGSNTTIQGLTSGSGATLTNLVTVDGGGTAVGINGTIFGVFGLGVAINNLNINNGFALNGPGGALTNIGSVIVSGSTFTGNQAVGSGGAIYNAFGGSLSVVNSTFSSNNALMGNGGAIDNANYDGCGATTVNNSTFYQNFAVNGGNGYGGAIYNDYNGPCTLTVDSSTIVQNFTDNSNPSGAGIYSYYSLYLANNVITGNMDSSSSEDDLDDNFWNSNYTSGNNIINGNLIGTWNGETENGMIVNLAPLGNYGGPTQTMLPLPGSAAICAGVASGIGSGITIDQRGDPNTNITYTGYSAGSPCVDSGSVQTNYTSVQFQQSSYTGVVGGLVTPAVLLSVTENGASQGAVPVTLSYSGPGNLSGNTATTAVGVGAQFPSLSVDTAGSGTLSTTILIFGATQLSASATFSNVPLQIAPVSQTISIPIGVPFSRTFSVSGGSGNYQLFNAGTLPPGLTLTPSGTAAGTYWTLSGTPTANGSYNFTLSVTDVTNGGVILSKTYTVSVAAATTTTLAASPASPALFGQTVTLTATVSSPTANGTVSFFDGGNLLGTGAVSLSGGSPNTATAALNASTLGSPLAIGAHSFTAQFSGDAADAASTSNTVPYNIATPNLVVNTASDDSGTYPCTVLASTTSNTTDGNNSGNPGLCTLRDALQTASGLGAAGIYFDTSVFTASNPGANTISLYVPGNGSLNIPSNTTIQGLTSGSGSTLTNLVTVDGGGTGYGSNGTIFVVNGTNAAINNLNINHGFASGGGSGGAITNFGSIAISGSSFTGNQASGFGGAIFNASGTVTVVNSTFSSNSTTGGNGGAIDNSNYSGCNTTTVSNSTFYQNSAANSGSGVGGAINNDGGCPSTVTVNNSTIVGNSSDGGGSGIYNSGILNLTNTVISGNTNNSTSSADDVDDLSNQGGIFWNGSSVINGNLIGVYDGNPQNGTSVTLSPLGNYGGPTQTMLPLPGSVAICAGIAISATTDQRGDPWLPTGGYCPSGTVDAGAVQSNYALSFTTEPPSSALTVAPLSPAPVVTLTESGAVFAPATSTVTMTDLGGGLSSSGTNSVALSSGSATFSNLIFSAVETSDTLQASLSLNPNLSPALNIVSLPSTAVNVAIGSPTITSVSAILPQQTQTITINGSGFGTQAPYNGDSSSILFADPTGTPWYAGDTGNAVTLAVSSWTDSQIVITGFTGAYGTDGECIKPGDQLYVKVWNAQTGSGPAYYAITAGSGTNTCVPGPTITSVSAILPQQTQTITISGSGFGTHAAYNGDLSSILVADSTGTPPWYAGDTGDAVTLAVSSWTDSQIVITGFTGAYGTDGQCIKPSDQLYVKVWNAQTGSGPAYYPITAGSGTNTCVAVRQSRR